MKLAIVTGGSRGLGLALCELLLDNDYQVIEFSRSAPHSYSVKLDLGSPAGVRVSVIEALSSFKPATLTELLVINNAGTLAPIGPVSRKRESEVLDNMNTNFAGAILIISTVAGQFQSSDCRKVIANVSSGAALKGYPGWSLYCAAKAGLENFIRALAAEQRLEKNPFVAVNIDPGVIDTAMQTYIRSSSLEDFPDVERFVQFKEHAQLKPAKQVALSMLKILTHSDISSGARYSTADY